MYLWKEPNKLQAPCATRFAPAPSIPRDGTHEAQILTLGGNNNDPGPDCQIPFHAADSFPISPLTTTLSPYQRSSSTTEDSYLANLTVS